MGFQDLPIRRKLTAITMLTSITALVLTATAFTVFDVVSHRAHLVSALTAKAATLARQSAPALAAKDPAAARQVLAALQADPQVEQAALYDSQGRLVAQYPAAEEPGALPRAPGALGTRFEAGGVACFVEVLAGTTPLGTLYLKSDRGGVYLRLRSFTVIALLVLGSAVLVAWVLSQLLQRRICAPILALARTARTISERGDFSLRAPKSGGDELGLLTDAFNQMVCRVQESRGRLSAIIGSAMDAVISVDARQRITMFNAAAEKMFRCPAGQALGQSLDQFIPPRYREAHRQHVEEFGRSGATARAMAHLRPLVGVRADGQEFPMEASISYVEVAGEKIYTVILRDITERQQTQGALEQQARTLREQAELVDLANVLARDLEDRIVLWNTGMEKLYGWTKAEALGQNSHALLRTEFPEPLETLRAQVLREGQWTGELVHHRKDGSRLTVASQWVLHKDEQGNPAAILEANTDITERKQAEEQIRLLNLDLERRVERRTAELTAANKELEAFTYSVAHDLRAPLRHIDAFTRIVHEEYSAGLPEEALRYLENICKGSRHMSQLVDDLLNLARVGRQELKRRPTSLDQLVREVLADLKQETQGRTIEWRLQPLPTVACDPGLMKQVFANLLANAVKYTRPRPVAIIEVGCLKMNGDSALYVRDNGVGFNMKYADKLFGVFQRLHRAEEFEGTGVGLATVERIVRKHGGCVWAEGAVDKGAAFYLSFPGLDTGGEAPEL